MNELLNLLENVFEMSPPWTAYRPAFCPRSSQWKLNLNTISFRMIEARVACLHQRGRENQARLKASLEEEGRFNIDHGFWKVQQQS